MLILSAPNSNPKSAFSHFEIREHAPVAAGLDVSHFVLIGRYNPETEKPGARTLYRSAELEEVKELLVEINGPIPEESEE